MTDVSNKLVGSMQQLSQSFVLTGEALYQTCWNGDGFGSSNCVVSFETRPPPWEWKRAIPSLISRAESTFLLARRFNFVVRALTSWNHDHQLPPPLLNPRENTNA